MARHGGLHATGSYKTGGRSSLNFRGVYSADIGTTVLVASMRDEGHTFHESRTPVHLSVLSQNPRLKVAHHPVLLHLQS